MNRCTALRMSGRLFVAAALLMSLEGVSHARTTREPIRTVTEAPRVSPVTIVDELARVRVCHISRHPRDGVPATGHACPLVIADAAEVVVPVSSATRAD
jgi:hypothetical protein